MQTIVSVAQMQAAARTVRAEGRHVGLVPTMGALHEGHLSLVRRAKEASHFCVVSVFVNPTQFGPGEDFERYTRDLETDAEACRAAGVEVLFAPAEAEMYAAGHSVFVDEDALSKVLCGATRPTHFRGVLTVVAKLLNAVLPDVVVLGQKDAQQAILVGRMIRDLNFPVQLVVCDTVREPDGLAMSSRNAYLSAAERKQAGLLYASLLRMREMYETGVKDVAVLKAAAEGVLRDTDARVRIDPEYIEVADLQTLQPVACIERPALVAAAVRVGSTRLIDNIMLPEGHQVVNSSLDNLARCG